MIDSVEFAVFVVPLGSDRAVDQHPAVAVLDEQTAQGQLDAVALVDRMPLLPQRLGNDAEHRASIEGEGAVTYFVQLESSQAVRHSLSRSFGKTSVGKMRSTAPGGRW